MKYNLLIISAFGLILCGCNSDSSDVVHPTNLPEHTNYGHNILVASDLSNRIKNFRTYDDPQILELITGKLRTAFQKNADVGINGKFFFTTINDEDFRSYPHDDSLFKIDLSRFKTIVERSNYLHHNLGKYSINYDIGRLNAGFREMYEAKKIDGQLPADLWYFFKDKLAYPLIDTSSNQYISNGVTIIRKYTNYIIIITDGYIEAGRYSDNRDMKENNKLRFLSENEIKNFRDEFKQSKSSSLEEFFTKNGYGIIPIQNELLSDSKVLVLELFDRSIRDGVNTEYPTDLEIIKLFWKDWLLKSRISATRISLNQTFSNKQNLDEVITKFLDIKNVR